MLLNIHTRLLASPMLRAVAKACIGSPALVCAMAISVIANFRVVPPSMSRAVSNATLNVCIAACLFPACPYATATSRSAKARLPTSSMVRAVSNAAANVRFAASLCPYFRLRTGNFVQCRCSRTSVVHTFHELQTSQQTSRFATFAYPAFAWALAMIFNIDARRLTSSIPLATADAKAMIQSKLRILDAG